MGPRVVSKNQHIDFNRDSMYGDERLKFLLIKDDSECKGFGVFKTLLNKYAESNANTVLINIDSPVEDIISGVEFNEAKLQIFDEFESSTLTTVQEKESLRERYLERIKNFEGILCIYSLTSLLIEESTSMTYKFLYELMNVNPKLQIVTLLHCDVHSTSDVRIIESLATAVIDVTSVVGNNKFLLTVATRNKAYGQTTYDFLMSSKFTFESICISTPKLIKIPGKKHDPTANLTFNLNLNEKEKAAREQLELPYTKVPVTESIVSQDLEDFYEEEEDPDDDLPYLESV